MHHEERQAHSSLTSPSPHHNATPTWGRHKIYGVLSTAGRQWGHSAGTYPGKARGRAGQGGHSPLTLAVLNWPDFVLQWALGLNGPKLGQRGPDHLPVQWVTVLFSGSSVVHWGKGVNKKKKSILRNAKCKKKKKKDRQTDGAIGRLFFFPSGCEATKLPVFGEIPHAVNRSNGRTEAEAEAEAWGAASGGEAGD